VRRAISHSDLPAINSRDFQRITQEGYVDADAVAAFLSVERRQVLEMTRKGIIPAHPLGTGRSRRIWRYKLSEVDAAVVSGAHKDGALARKSSPRTISPGSPRSQKEKSNG
jgi:hypothetical protein